MFSNRTRITRIKPHTKNHKHAVSFLLHHQMEMYSIQCERYSIWMFVFCPSTVCHESAVRCNKECAVGDYTVYDVNVENVSQTFSSPQIAKNSVGYPENQKPIEINKDRRSLLVDQHDYVESIFRIDWMWLIILLNSIGKIFQSPIYHWPVSTMKKQWVNTLCSHCLNALSLERVRSLEQLSTLFAYFLPLSFIQKLRTTLLRLVW